MRGPRACANRSGLMASAGWGLLAAKMCVMEIHELTASDLHALQSLIERCGDLFQLTEDRDPDPDEARELWDAVPFGTPREAKHVLGVFDPELVGVVEIVRDWPRPGTWNVGLLMFDPAVRRRGAGTVTMRVIDRWAGASGADRLRISVMPANIPALAFWRALGFADVAAVPGFARRAEHAVAIALERPIEAQQQS
jgi:RimJ/RimL family protein N-acetyltransferase